MKLYQRYRNVIKRRKELLTEMLNLKNVPSFIILRQLKLIEQGFFQWVIDIYLTWFYFTFIYKEEKDGRY